ncbi:MAG TPA: ATP-binding cassette domain-containing protein [Candidatus Angelobacter sp.]|nr:ATP-binding cassette domain-containing protein [Candidatus Angelobacter sp.]
MTSNSQPGAADFVATMREVTLTYDGYLTRALAKVNLGFRGGEITGVLGVKGSGKSTALRLLAGRLRPTEGTVKVFGRPARRGAAKARIGYLPGKMDAVRRVGFFGRLFGGKPESPTAARGVARLTQAILGNRDLLILDDPFADLDAAELAEAKALIRDLAGRGKTVILSSDALLEVKDLCQRIAILHEGRVQAIGTLTELLSSGEAIRFLPAILPPDMNERVLKVLRAEILSNDVAAAAQPAGTSASSKKPGGETPPPPEPRPDDTIDHEKLEELVKRPKPE